MAKARKKVQRQHNRLPRRLMHCVPPLQATFVFFSSSLSLRFCLYGFIPLILSNRIPLLVSLIIPLFLSAFSFFKFLRMLLPTLRFITRDASKHNIDLFTRLSCMTFYLQEYIVSWFHKYDIHLYHYQFLLFGNYGEGIIIWKESMAFCGYHHYFLKNIIITYKKYHIHAHSFCVRVYAYCERVCV